MASGKVEPKKVGKYERKHAKFVISDLMKIMSGLFPRDLAHSLSHRNSWLMSLISQPKWSQLQPECRYLSVSVARMKQRMVKTQSKFTIEEVEFVDKLIQTR